MSVTEPIGFTTALELKREYPHSNDNSVSNILEVVYQNGSCILAPPICFQFCSSLGYRAQTKTAPEGAALVTRFRPSAFCDGAARRLQQGRR